IVAGMTAVTRRAGRHDCQFDIDGACILELERQRNTLTFNERLLYFHQHEVKATRGEFKRATGRDFQTIRHWTHVHDALLDLHRMDFNTSCDGRGAADQTVGRRAFIGNGQVAATNLGRRQSGAGPWMANFKLAETVFVRKCECGGASQDEGSSENTGYEFHSVLQNAWLCRRRHG